MSATHRSEPSAAPPARAPRDIAVLQSRRRAANRRRRLLRIDLAVGLLVGIVLLLATPGLAIAAILAGAALAACVVSVFVQRRRARGREPGVRRAP